VLTEKGLRGVTVAGVVGRAEVSSSTFREIFKSVDGCFLALLEHVTMRSTALIVEAFERETSWQDGVLAGLEALLLFLDSEPALARVCVVEAFAGPLVALERRTHLLEPLKPLVDGGRKQLPDDAKSLSLTPDATIAMVAGILHMRFVEGQVPPFIGLLGELTGSVVAPYIGASAAARATERGNARARVLAQEMSAHADEVTVSIPKEIRHASAERLRLCLAYVADNPGASNHAIAIGIDLSHLGQTSTALSRLKQAGLLTKQPGGPGRPNAWWLSPHGEAVVRALDYR
jgi:AcrR family transcriptional regulator